MTPGAPATPAATTAPAAATPIGAQRAFYRTDPQCVLVQPDPGSEQTAAGTALEAALARQLSSRFNRVIGAGEQRRVARTLALDPASATDMRRTARRSGCPAILYWSLTADEHDKTPLWSRREISVTASLRRSDDDVELWRGQHAVRRASGDPPLSLFSLPLAAYKAAKFDRSPELAASMADDLARGLFVSLPDLRQLGPTSLARRNSGSARK